MRWRRLRGAGFATGAVLAGLGLVPRVPVLPQRRGQPLPWGAAPTLALSSPARGRLRAQSPWGACLAPASPDCSCVCPVGRLAGPPLQAACSAPDVQRLGWSVAPAQKVCRAVNVCVNLDF